MARPEGRSDPLNALVGFKPTPPKILFYDNACALAQTAYKWAPNFFVRTRLYVTGLPSVRRWHSSDAGACVLRYHDVFHSYGHICSSAFRSRLHPDTAPLNTSAAEQLNAALQCLKHSASGMGQARFIFFCLFFLTLLNDEKNKRREAEARLYSRFVV